MTPDDEAAGLAHQQELERELFESDEYLLWSMKLLEEAIKENHARHDPSSPAK